ncbi:hypothetical protein HMPREF3038_02072 [Akkermansia sp. KLE1797]|nr:hypothetical protein HMPREF3038_02072 [Akkermansia sp. KLE1797]
MLCFRFRISCVEVQCSAAVLASCFSCAAPWFRGAVEIFCPE